MAARPRRKRRNLGDTPALTPAQGRALARLNDAGLLDALYLADGVGVACHLHHRRSVDLDLFSTRTDLDLDAIAERAHEAKIPMIGRTDATVTFRIGRVPIDIVRYRYKPLARLERGPEGVRLAALRDLAVMKVAAIARRGIRRDFWDLYEIATRTPHGLARIMDDYRRKFRIGAADLYHVLRALTWFEDAERDRVMPAGLTRTKWLEIRRWFEVHVPAELVRRTRRATDPKRRTRGSRP